MSIDLAKLIAYADGELSAAELAEVEAALAADPALRVRLEKQLALRAKLSAAYDAAISEPVPERFAHLMQTPQESAKVVDLSARRAARWSVREWGAIAASTVLGVVLGVGVMSGNAPMIAPHDGGMAARGALARALDTQLAADQTGAVRIGLSFERTGGGYCRTFDLTDENTSGLACREGDDWRIAVTARSTGGGEVRQAGAPPEILAAVDTIIEGDALDAEGERAARDNGWR
jgi:hypothetical protein